MAPYAQAVIVLCVVLLTLALVPTLLALRKTALRAESVLHQVEREIRPMVSQLEALGTELRDLSRSANEEMKYVSVVVQRADEISLKVSNFVGAVAGLTRVGQYATMIAAMKKGLEVFVRGLKAKP